MDNNTLKVFFKEEIRRFALREISVKWLMRRLEDTFFLVETIIELSYFDEEKDRVRVTCDEELKAAFESAVAWNGVLKLHVSIRSRPFIPAAHLNAFMEVREKIEKGNFNLKKRSKEWKQSNPRKEQLEDHKCEL